MKRCVLGNSLVRKHFFLLSFDDKYALIAEYSQDTRSGSMKVVKSVAAYISEEGEVLVPLLKKEVDLLIKNLLKSD